MSNRDTIYILRWAKKIKAINVLGGKCQKCGNNNIFSLTFHHNKNKQYMVSILLDRPWKVILREARKCSILCFNCHQELHFPKSSSIKDKTLMIKGKNRCYCCGYRGKSNSSLSFHHIGKNCKEKAIGELCNYTENRFNATISTIKRELQKCIVVCENCHQYLYHSNRNRFNKLKKKIYGKILFLDHFVKKTEPKKNYNKLDNKKMEKMCEAGKTYKEISEALACSVSTVKKYLKRKHIALRSRNKKISNLRKTILRLWKKGVMVQDIARIVGHGETFISISLGKCKDVIEYRLKRQQKAKKRIGLMIKLYRKGYTTKEISSVVNLSRVHVGRILKNNHIILRKAGARKASEMPKNCIIDETK